MRGFAIYLCLLCLLVACSPAPATDLAPAASRLVFLRAAAGGNFQLFAQADLQSQASLLPFDFPSNCTVYQLYPNPIDPLLAIEFECEGAPVVMVVNTATFASPVSHNEARFLAWSADGRFLYLKTNSLGNPQVVRLDNLPNAIPETLSLPPTLYDLAALPDGHIIYSTTQGIGFGSETWLAEADGRRAARLLSQPLDIVAYLRPSPDGKQVAFIRFPDSQTPFPDGELWVMDVSGKNARALAEADAGHGYAPAWSPDGSQIAFVVRENPQDPQADVSAGALRSNLYRIEVHSGARTPLTAWPDAIAETPVWSPDGAFLVFNVARNDTIQVWFEHAGAVQPLSGGVTCCAVWVPGR